MLHTQKKNLTSLLQQFFFFFGSKCIWYNFKALVPLTKKLNVKDKFMLQIYKFMFKFV